MHHNNILTSGDSRKAIDPHGVIGEKVLETARFIENEIQKQEINQDNVVEAIKLISKYYKEDKQLICKALFIDHVLSTCWDIEDNSDVAHISSDIENLKTILNCLNEV